MNIELPEPDCYLHLVELVHKGVLKATPEGDGTLLDRCLVYAHSDCQIAKGHSLTSVPMMNERAPNSKPSLCRRAPPY